MPEKRTPRRDHLGHFFYNYMRKIKNEICQLDAATGEQETCGSVLSRSIRLTQCFSKLGLQIGDPIAIGGRNHLDVHIPFYAGLMSGLPVAGIDPALKKCELKHLLKIVEPKLAFCDLENLQHYQQAVQELGSGTRIVTFGGDELSLNNLMTTYQDLRPEDTFQVAVFDPEKVYCWLCSTSGSTGRPKVVALTHFHMVQKLTSFNTDRISKGESRTALNLSTLHWLAGCYNALLMPIHHIKLQTSAPATPDDIIHIINKYKPRETLCSPSFLAPILQSKTSCDFTCFELLILIGSKIHNEFLVKLKAKVRQDTNIYCAYGMTETYGALMTFLSKDNHNDMGILLPGFEGKLMNPDSGEEIVEPDVTGELHVKSQTMAIYYNDPAATRAAYTEDGYFKTGDLFYRDEHDHYFFVDRLKMLLKYKNYQARNTGKRFKDFFNPNLTDIISPRVVEDVIRRLPGVRDVCVAGAPRATDGERAVACVVREQGAEVSAQEVKDHVAKHLSASKHLHGGVLFLDSLPTTSSGKLARFQVKNVILTARRE